MCMLPTLYTQSIITLGLNCYHYSNIQDPVSRSDDNIVILNVLDIFML